MIASVSGCQCHLWAEWLGSESAAELYVDERVDGAGHSLYLDREGSVSAFGDGDGDYDVKSKASWSEGPSSRGCSSAAEGLEHG